MSRIVFDAIGEKGYRYGVSKTVLYLLANKKYANGVAFNGVTGINENPSGADENAVYADNIKYASMFSNEEFGASLEAVWYPDEWSECDGEKSALGDKKGVYVGQQKRKSFGLCYRTELGNDAGEDAYELHLIYGATAKPSSKSHKTVNTSIENETFSWDIATTPVPVSRKDKDGNEMRPTAHIRINTSEFEDKTVIEKLEAILYGDETHEPMMPLPDDVFKILNGEDVDVYAA